MSMQRKGVVFEISIYVEVFNLVGQTKDIFMIG
jgi:hypothetical protein